jgi:hypothetical protein
MMEAALLALLLGAPPAGPAVTIYVGPVVRDGFVDADKGVQDSVVDLRVALGRLKDLRVVDTERAADLRLYVIRRGIGAPNGGINIQAAPTVGIYVPVNSRFVETTLRVGDYERPIVGEDRDHENWKRCAKLIAADLRSWLAANRERVAAK